MGHNTHYGRRAGLLIIALFIAASLICAPEAAWGIRIYAAEAYGAEPQTVYKTFDQMTREEKQRALDYLMEEGTVPARIRVGGGTYQLNQELWHQKGIIVYGNTANVNGAVQTTASPNYRDGQYRYWGYDRNGGLYGNDDFPRDSDSGIPPWRKNWMTTGEIRVNGTAKGYVGQFAMNADFPETEKLATASAFLSQNPAFRSFGMDEEYIVNHFYFNAAISDSGLTQGQFVGVHLSPYDSRLYYQTFSVSVETRLFLVPPPAPPSEIPDSPVSEDPVPLPGPGASVEAACALALPARTFEGHPALAEDISLFSVDGETWSARRAYEEGLGENRFSIREEGSAGPPASCRISRLSQTRAEAVFHHAGLYHVELAVIPTGGSAQYDVKAISVLRTPTILHSLTGTQKQNRKQMLNLQIATHPDYPLTELRVELMLPATGEKVTLVHQLDPNLQNQNENGETIKTRPIVPLLSDRFFQNCRLEFLTKNPEAADYSYTVYAKDSRGHEDQVTVDFPAAKDLPPAASVNMEAFFVRGEHSNTAEILAEDGTLTDGDQLKRTWYYLPLLYKKGGSESGIAPFGMWESPGAAFGEGDPGSAAPGIGESGGGGEMQDPFAGWISLEETAGYKDLSFGAGKRISFEKDSVGRFRVGLLTEEVWTEETLPEYISPEDYLAGFAISEAEVINIAPVVSLSPIRRAPMDITILAGGDAEYEHAKGNRALLEKGLLDRGIAGRIQIEKMRPAAGAPEGNPAKAVMEAYTPFGYEGGWTFYENQNFIVDEEKLYKIDATWTSALAGSYPQSPYTISAWEARTGRLAWTYSFSAALFTVPGSGPYFAQDHSGRFLFFIAGGRTMVLSKDTGSLLTVLNFETGSNICAGKDSMYCIKSDGIYRIRTQTGEIKRIYNGRSSGETRVIGGKVHFLSISGAALYRGIFDPDTETVSLKRLPEGQVYSGLPVFRAIGIDTEGKIIVNLYTSAGSSHISETRVYGGDNRILRSVSMSDSSSNIYRVTPVYDAGGVCNYIAYTYDGRSSSAYYGYVKLYGVHSGYSGTVSVSDKNGYPTDTSQVIFARELSGKVYLSTGAYWTYILNTGSYGNGPAHGYPERTKVFVFDPAAGSAAAGTVNQLGIGLVTREYGRSSDSLAAIQTGNNHIGLSHGSETVVTAWSQSLSEILGRYTDRLISGDRANTLILYDETNRALYTESLTAQLESRLKSRNGRLILADPALMEDSEGLAQVILGLAEEGGNVLGVQADQGIPGEIRKTFELLPDTTYYYEYEIRRSDGKAEDSMDLTMSVQGIQGVSAGAGVFGAVHSYFEDFNDADTEPFFQLVPSRQSEGIYKGGNVYNRQGSDWSNKYFADSSSVTFTVPEGYQAVLSFDYQNDQESEKLWTASFVQINSQAWHEFTPGITNQGFYCHPYLLPEGRNTLAFYARAYGGRETAAKMYIDNLRVDLVKPGSEDKEAWDGSKQTLGVELLADGYSRISGSFRTPLSVGSYREIAGAQVIKGPVGTAPYTAAVVWETGNREARYSIPAGKTAILTLLSTSSKPVIYNDRTYNATYSWNGYTWSSALKNEYPQSARNNIPANYRIPLPAMTGTQTFKASATDYRGADATITGIESMIIDSSQSFLKNRKVFIADQGLGAKAFAEADLFENLTDVKLQFPVGGSFLRNLKIYTYREGAKVYAVKETFSDPTELAAWRRDGAAAAVIRDPSREEGETKSLIYQKGEIVEYGIFYSDYEGDPSKKKHWVYTHTPGNDGPHPDAAVILDESQTPVDIRDKVLPEPVKTFYIDGKYTAEHWQEDNTARPPAPAGNPDYDKASNVEAVTFYIAGGTMGPWIESIRTIPSSVKEGQDYEIEVRVNDNEKDVLRLHTEVYKERQLVYSHDRPGITADSGGQYPPVLISSQFPAMAGSYEIVCTVRDQSGMGLGSYRFKVLSAGRIEGSVSHTASWDDNRKRYNLFYFKEEFNRQVSLAEYLSAKHPRRRGVNVFWPGERFLLSAYAAGEPLSVSAGILGPEGYQIALRKTGRKNAAGETLYEGELWDSSMRYRWGIKKPEEVVFRFTADYGGGTVKTHDVPVILDGTQDYWLLHRLW